jgi:hypothetical protein
MWYEDDNVRLAIRGLYGAMRSLSPKSRAEFKHAARVQVRRLILRRRLEAAKLLRVMTATVDPQLRGD